MDDENHKKTARSLFEEEIDLFKRFDKSSQEEAINLLENPTDKQIKALAYLFIFIAKQEIPILKEYRNKIRLKDLKKITEISKRPEDTLQLAKDDLLALLRRFSSYIPFLVKPILYDH